MPDDVTPNPSEQNSNREAAPAWAQKELSDVRNEAADYRVKLRTKTEEHTVALGQITTLSDEKTGLTKQLEAATLSNLKLTIALDAGVPGDRVRSIADRLVGNTEEELKADAAKLIADFGLTGAPDRATDPNQGRTNTNTPITNDPASSMAGFLKSAFERM